MDHALRTLGFSSMDHVTPEILKRSFKNAVINAHPDKGGSEDDFETILSAYVYLSNMIKRMSGGRDGFQILDPSDVKQSRDDQFTNELNNLVSEIFDQVQSCDHDVFRKEFNEQFEKNHIREDQTGYEEWLRSHPDEEDQKTGSNDPVEWNQAFETYVKQGKPEPTSIILHPDEMAFVSGSTRGSALIPSVGHSFTSEPEECPEYTDLHAAYTSENTVFDKVPVYQDKIRTLDDILLERDKVYQANEDHDLAAISAYEQRKQAEEKEHKEKIAEYFKGTSSSVWALKSIPRTDSESFVKEFK